MTKAYFTIENNGWKTTTLKFYDLDGNMIIPEFPEDVKKSLFNDAMLDVLVTEDKEANTWEACFIMDYESFMYKYAEYIEENTDYKYGIFVVGYKNKVICTRFNIKRCKAVSKTYLITLKKFQKFSRQHKYITQIERIGSPTNNGAKEQFSEDLKIPVSELSQTLIPANVFLLW